MSEIQLSALDGSNPLGFLAALGTHRLLQLKHPNERIRLCWLQQGGWRPVLTGLSDPEQIAGELLEAHTAPLQSFESLGKNITVSANDFAGFVKSALEKASPSDTRIADFAAAFGSEVCIQEKKDRIQYTKLCFITGSGHQDFLGTMKGLKQNIIREHIHDALFGQWLAQKGLSMRWDPADAVEYALRWNDPGPEGASAVWGANYLAIEALPLFPTHVTRRGLETTGFTRRHRRDEFTWPIWTQYASLDTVGSLLSLDGLQEENVNRRELEAIGINEIFRSERLRIGQGANFKVSFGRARAVQSA